MTGLWCDRRPGRVPPTAYYYIQLHKGVYYTLMVTLAVPYGTQWF